MSLLQPLVLKMIHNKLQVVLFLSLFRKFESNSQRESYQNFPKVTCLRWIHEPVKTLTTSDHIAENIVNQYLKFKHPLRQDFTQMGFFRFIIWSFAEKNFVVKIPRWLVISRKILTWGGYEGHNLYKFLGWGCLQQVNIEGI